VLTEHARRYLIAEGIRPETIIKTGSHMQEVLDYYMPKVKDSQIVDELSLEECKYFVVSAHREENVDSEESLRGLLDGLTGLADTWGYPVIVSVHPRTRKRLDALGDLAASALTHRLIRFSKPFGLTDYLKLQLGAFCVLSDSGTISEEASLLNLPAITLRAAHERPEGMDEGTLIMSDLTRASIIDSVRVVTSQHVPGGRVIPLVPDYAGGPVSKQVVRVVLSYTAYVNRTVWRKY
jgi:UDP-N-acetylglucosamine 2-epimerase (non-hydrolysing)